MEGCHLLLNIIRGLLLQRFNKAYCDDNRDYSTIRGIVDPIDVDSGNDRAYPEKVFGIPLNPWMDQRDGRKLYKWGCETEGPRRWYGARQYEEDLDNLRGRAVQQCPWDSEGKVFEKRLSSADGNLDTTDRINTQYSHQLRDTMPEDGYAEASGPGGRPIFHAGFQKLLAYHHGLYRPDAYGECMSDEDILARSNAFAEAVHSDDPDDACKYLLIEEHTCLLTHQADKNIEAAATKCIKWHDEWQKCMWDQYKFNNGINFIERRPHYKHKSYIASPDYQYS